MGRYDKYRILTNASDYYKPLREERGVKFIKQYETPMLRNPSRAVRRKITTTKHLWKYGDRFYKLANQYYTDVRFWWVIAWYNSAPTEANLITGDVIAIPINIEETLKVLGAM